ncbi:MAG TPA: haloacid dehalogenase-like hydrolase [Pseudomonadota bacterium]|nr:haloacid dehalogenase-like hydrolase [Pseudomonadota bacterium]
MSFRFAHGLLLAFGSLLLSCDPPIPAQGSLPDMTVFSTRRLDPSLSWWGDNRKRLDDFMVQSGIGSVGYDATKKPVALFDWDNTVIKNDIGDLMLFWMLKAGKIYQPANFNWRLTSISITTDALNLLRAACDGLASPGSPLPTNRSDTAAVACTDAILSVYLDNKGQTGLSAFAGYDYRRMEPTYAWAVQLQAGYTPAEISLMAKDAIAEGLAAAVGATQKIGSRTVNAYVRVYDQIKDLIGAMQENGFDVWVITATSEPVVRAFADQVKIPTDHVIGVRMVLDGNGKLTYNLQGCGDVPDGINDGGATAKGNSLMTYIDGKRCWVNKVIYGDASPTAINPRPDGKRQLFAAGDSNTDVTFVRDAEKLKLVINRNKAELMCNAYGNFGNRYLVNPMFIDPKPQQTALYPCTTTACVNSNGMATPCLDEGQGPIADQKDAVYPM